MALSISNELSEPNKKKLFYDDQVKFISKCSSEHNFEISAINERSNAIFRKGQHALVGVSPFNSYFSEYNMKNLFTWALNYFKKVTVFMPETLSIFTLMALGYERKKATDKGRRQDNYLRNRIERVIDQMRIDGGQEIQRLTIMTFPKIFEDVRYQHFYAKWISKFEQDKCFREGCLTTSSWVLSGHLKDRIPTKGELEMAVQYFLYELPLFMNTPEVLDVESSLFVYNSISTFLKNLYDIDDIVSPTQGYLTVKL